jgi:hypothetical protein
MIFSLLTKTSFKEQFFKTFDFIRFFNNSAKNRSEELQQ